MCRARIAPAAETPCLTMSDCPTVIPEPVRRMNATASGPATKSPAAVISIVRLERVTAIEPPYAIEMPAALRFRSSITATAS
jgi:hypothetical protein